MQRDPNNNFTEDIYSYQNPISFQMKTINNVEDSLLYDDLLLKVLNSHKLTQEQAKARSANVRRLPMTLAG